MRHDMLDRARAALVAAVCLGLWAHLANAQLSPDRTYYGINRAAPMTVAMPAGVDGAAEIALLEPETAKVLDQKPVQPGGVDIAAIFPSLWTTQTPKVVYAQLLVGGKKVGPAVVIQPMVSAAYPVVIDPVSGMPRFPLDSRRRVYSGFRAYVDKHVVLDTTAGSIEIELRPDAAPTTAWNFRELVEGGFYTDVIFHRVVAVNQQGNPFVIQVGDPTGKGEGGPGYNIDLEPSTLPHDFGVVSMARNDDPNTAGSQFFLCLSRDGTAALDGRYTSFGRCVSGAETILAIARTPILPPGSDGRDRPANPPVIRTAKLVDAPPYGEGPRPLQDPRTVPIRK
ncbi:MAG: peptidylprolyl isomerase [Phycisphaeraceae bacterium]|nr:peptidylprolyl isomerase [Phycisphaeraceae bacterium]